MKPQTFIFFGRSGCGKGTQLQKLKEHIEKQDKKKGPSENLIHLEMGELFRSFWKKQGYTADLSREIMERGDLQPAFLQISLWSSFFVDKVSKDKHLFIDGSPRRILDAEVMDSAFKFYRRNKPYFIMINVSEDESRRRIIKRAEESGRKEDQDPKKIEGRLLWFKEHTLPVADFFYDNPNYHFVEVDGEKSIEDIHRDILKKVSL